MAPRMTIEAMLAEARAQLERLGPLQARAAIDGADALLIDIRQEWQRAADGVVPDAVYFARNVLEWRCDPASDAWDPRVGGLDRRLVVMCDEGYTSSLAAASLQRLGFARATDLEGGFQAWRAAGLDVMPMDDERSGHGPAEA
jgi:rhodanese-related sulfurtransferase